MRLSDTGSGEPLGFTFDGEPVAAVAGDTVASALAAAGIVRVRRSTSDDDAMRGVWCGMGVCFDCLVTMNGRAGQRACLAKIEGGEEVRSRSPDGTGDDALAPLAEAPTSPHMPERSVDVLVVGAGPAGLSAALAARRHGVSVTVLDERARSGGQYYKQMAGGAAPPADRQGRAGARLIEAARAAGVELIQDAHVFGAFAADDLVALIDGTAQQFRPKRLILATGAYERPMPFPGWTLPGVMTTGAAQTLERAYDVAPGQRVVIAGNGPLNFQLAASLVAKGVEVAAVAEASPRPHARDWQAALQATVAAPDLIAAGLGYLWRLRRARVPILWAHRAVTAHGDGSVAAVDLAPIDDAGRPQTGACDDLRLRRALPRLRLHRLGRDRPRPRLPDGDRRSPPRHGRRHHR